MKWILASSSPRRKELLKEMGVDFKVIPSHEPENRKRGESPSKFVRRLAVLKARSIANKIKSEEDEHLVIGADTIVVLRGKIFGKPRSVRHAGNMLLQLSGKMHRVYTGVALINSKSGKVKSGLSVSKVYFRKISKDEAPKIGGKHLDKSGSYACQDKVDRLVNKIDGDWQGVMGLPIKLVKKLVR